MMITDIQIKADGSSIYGCMNASGETKWFREYELELSNTPKSRLGFTVEIVADERQD